MQRPVHLRPTGTQQGRKLALVQPDGQLGLVRDGAAIGLPKAQKKEPHQPRAQIVQSDGLHLEVRAPQQRAEVPRHSECQRRLLLHHAKKRIAPDHQPPRRLHRRRIRRTGMPVDQRHLAHDSPRSDRAEQDLPPQRAGQRQTQPAMPQQDQRVPFVPALEDRLTRNPVAPDGKLRKRGERPRIKIGKGRAAPQQLLRLGSGRTGFATDGHRSSLHHARREGSSRMALRKDGGNRIETPLHP